MRLNGPYGLSEAMDGVAFAPGRGASLRRWAPRGLAALFAFSGIVHLVRPQTFTPTVPRVLPRPTAIVYLSGVAELACAAGLAAQSRWAGTASAALLLAVLPANVQMALDASAGEGAAGRTKAAVLWARLPLQAPLIWAALQSRRHKQPIARQIP